MSNPLQSDGELQSLMSELDGITDADHFLRWRTSFVDRLEDYLGDAGGVSKAREADAQTASKMSKLDKTIENVSNNCLAEGGSLKAGVKSQMAINKLKEGCIDMEKRLTKLVPANTSDTKTCGYTKFHLGAVLVKDGFLIYKDMMRQEQILQLSILPSLEAANVDRQILDSIHYYFNRVRALVDVLTDLGLYKVMIKNNEFFPDEKTPAAVTKSAATICTPPLANQSDSQPSQQNIDSGSGGTKPDPVEPSAPATASADPPNQDDMQPGQAGARGGQTGPPPQHAAATNAGEPTEQKASQAEKQPSEERQEAQAATPASPTAEPQKKKQSAAAAKPAKQKKPKSKILPDSGGRGAKPANNNEKPKRYAVAPPKNPTPLTPVDDVQWEIKPQFNKNKNNNNKKSDKSSDDAGEEGDGDVDGDDDNTYLVFFDPLTQSMGMIPRQKCLQMGIINIGKDGMVEEGSDSPSEKRGLLQMIQQSVLGRSSCD